MELGTGSGMGASTLMYCVNERPLEVKEAKKIISHKIYHLEVKVGKKFIKSIQIMDLELYKDD